MPVNAVLIQVNCSIGIERFFFHTMNDYAAVKYQYRIEFGNFFYLKFFDLIAWFDLKTSLKIRENQSYLAIFRPQMANI